MGPEKQHKSLVDRSRWADGLVERKWGRGASHPTEGEGHSDPGLMAETTASLKMEGRSNKVKDTTNRRAGSVYKNSSFP